MNNNLEKYIQKNRPDFDKETPGENVWANIEKTIPGRKEEKRFSVKNILKWSAAATIVFAVIISVFFIYIKKYSQEPTPTVQIPAGENNNINYEELSSLMPGNAVEIEKIYTSIVTSQQELKYATSGQPELYKQFLNDLSALENSFQILKNQSTVTANKDLIIKAMIQNLRLQAELLYRQLMITNEFTQKTKQNEKGI
jgi:hypothetical protein